MSNKIQAIYTILAARFYPQQRSPVISNSLNSANTISFVESCVDGLRKKLKIKRDKDSCSWFSRKIDIFSWFRTRAGSFLRQKFKALKYHTLHSLFHRQKGKGRISKRLFQENKARQIFRKTNISYPLIRTRTCAYQGVRNVRFSENLMCFVFLKHPF